ncbi:HNH endonuclease [Sphingomonas ginkgonis]|uniref:HNH endonuclease n=1 Tax=Sphingomonas ginkgonis TaxID=2315330 RepID=A0A429V8G7_9SPHN|nr:HNH endonuclease signature motif containing protein [Sphingomonas ginkgonis]RST30147.1 HNH endonuclease [Sphingomonas ginkgonis]
MRERAEVLQDEPFCRHCAARSLAVRAVVVDHIKPLSEGGSDDRGNKQSLCKPCHDAKSKAERAAAARRRAGR